MLKDVGYCISLNISILFLDYYYGSNPYTMINKVSKYLQSENYDMLSDDNFKCIYVSMF